MRRRSFDAASFQIRMTPSRSAKTTATGVDAMIRNAVVESSMCLAYAAPSGEGGHLLGSPVGGSPPARARASFLTLAQATPWNRPRNDTLRIAQMNVSLRPLEDRDLDTIYQQVTDPESVRMAAFTAEDQTDRRAFLNRMSRLRADTSISYRVIDVDGAIAGTIASFRIDNQPEVTYWVDRTQWGKGIASAALQILLAETAERPLYARAASDNVGSLRVLEKAGFRRVGVNRDFAPGRGEEIEETILRLD